MVVAHITNLDVASLIPSGIALVVTGIIVGIYAAPRIARKARRKDGEY